MTGRDPVDVIIRFSWEKHCLFPGLSEAIHEDAGGAESVSTKPVLLIRRDPPLDLRRILGRH